LVKLPQLCIAADGKLTHHPWEEWRRYVVDFGDSPVRVEIHASEETVAIFVEADWITRHMQNNDEPRPPRTSARLRAG
jgi:hypothetical protein